MCASVVLSESCTKNSLGFSWRWTPSHLYQHSVSIHTSGCWCGTCSVAVYQAYTVAMPLCPSGFGSAHPCRHMRMFWVMRSACASTPPCTCPALSTRHRPCTNAPIARCSFAHGAGSHRARCMCARASANDGPLPEKTTRCTGAVVVCSVLSSCCVLLCCARDADAVCLSTRCTSACI